MNKTLVLADGTVLHRKKKFTKKEAKDLAFVLIMSFLPLLQFAIFYVYVNINAFVMAFQKYEAIDGKFVKSFVGFENFSWAFAHLGHSDLRFAFKNSLISFLVGLVIGTTMNLIFAYYVYKKRFGANAFKIILFLPSILSGITVALMFKYFTEYAIPEVMMKWFNVDLGAGLLSENGTAFGTMLFASVWFGFGGGMLMYVGAMHGISDSLVEAAELDGATLMQEFFHVTIPLMWPTLSTFLVTSFCGFFTSQVGQFSYFGDKASILVYTYGYDLYIQTYKGTRGQTAIYPKVASLGMFYTAITMPIVLGMRWLFTKFGPSAD